MKQAFIALGSNLENPAAQVRQALNLLSDLPRTNLVKASSLYCTVPVGYLEQPDFINAVAELETELTPHELLSALLNLETQMGRVRTFANAPRVLDLDLLWYEDINLNDVDLILPHPRMHERAFVILPLNEIAPNIEISSYGKVSELAKLLGNSGVTLAI